MMVFPNRKKRLGVFGGSFNPPTQAHFMLAEYLLDDYVDRVLFLPVGDAYPKPDLATAEHRLAMLRLAVEANPRFELCDIEARSPKRSYTHCSLQALRREFPTDELFFILGSDQLPGLSAWYRFDDLLQEFRFILLVRADDQPEALFASNLSLARYRDRFVFCAGHPLSDLSSNTLRRRVASSKSIRYLTEQRIAEYIERYGLYHTSPK